MPTGYTITVDEYTVDTDLYTGDVLYSLDNGETWKDLTSSSSYEYDDEGAIYTISRNATQIKFRIQPNVVISCRNGGVGLHGFFTEYTETQNYILTGNTSIWAYRSEEDPDTP